MALEEVFAAAVGVTTVALTQARDSQDLTLAQWRALVLLRDPAGTRVGKLARALGLSLSSASRLVGRMERRGLVSTARSERDRRATLVSITAHGSDVRQTVVARRQAMLRGVLARDGDGLPADTAQALRAVAAALVAYR